MLDPRQIAYQVFGAIDWQNEASGYCKCLGRRLHTSANGKKDFRVNVDGCRRGRAAKVQSEECRMRAAGERLVLETLRMHAERFRAELFDFFRWPMAQILEDSPLLVAERDPEDQFRTWLKLWPAHCTLWVGDVHVLAAGEGAGGVEGWEAAEVGVVEGVNREDFNR